MGVAHNNFHIFPRSVPAEAICSIGNWDHVNTTPHEFISKPLEIDTDSGLVLLLLES